MTEHVVRIQEKYTFIILILQLQQVLSVLTTNTLSSHWYRTIKSTMEIFDKFPATTTKKSFHIILQVLKAVNDKRI